MILFEEMTREHFPIVQSLYASVPEYACLEERALPLSDSILQKEFLNPDICIADRVYRWRTCLTD